MPRYSLGIDIGGTFTDVVAFAHEARCRFSLKVLTTPDEPARAVMEGTRALIERHGILPGEVRRVVHATTLFTNALIERKGARTGLITTSGFRDVLEIGRERKYDLYDIAIRNSAPLVPRHLRREVPERITADGRVRVPLDRPELVRQVDALVAEGVESVAICFLHSHANPAHEREAAEIVADRAPSLFVTTSHEVVNEIREYDRASTTVANAYVKPLAGRYIDDMAERLAGLGISAPLLMMLSNGGLTHIREAKRVPVRMLESGPAAGALAAGFFGRAEGDSRLLAFDMGGTTAKLSLIEDGEPTIAYAFEAARQKRFAEGSGLPIRVSTVELIEIGAGGGSIARRDEIGLLKVGPDSAGADPGPAAYGRGGTAPTVTDANLELGYIDPDGFAGGTVPIDMDAARAALGELAADLALDPIRTASGIHDVVNETMAAAARVHIAERGRDPARYSLLCTGGGGPLHGYRLARKLGLRRVICPPAAGVASALGLIVAPARIDRVATVGFRLDRDELADLEAAFRRLEADALAMVAETQGTQAAPVAARFADGRFVGQGFDLVVRLPPGPYDAGEGVRATLEAAFARAYVEAFARAPSAVPVEFLNIRVSATIAVEEAPEPAADEGAGEAPVRNRPVFFPEAGAFLETRVFRRGELRPGDASAGPAVVEEAGATLVIGPDARFEVSPSRNLIVTWS